MTQAKARVVDGLLDEYARLCNAYIQIFWELLVVPEQRELTKELVGRVPTCVSYSLALCAARHARGIVASATSNQTRAGKAKSETCPSFDGSCMVLSSNLARFEATASKTFDLWLVLGAIQPDKSVKKTVWIPLKKHKKYHQLAEAGAVCSTITVTRGGSVVVTFKISVEPKSSKPTCLGIDTGMTTLGMTHTGERFGTALPGLLARLDRCVYGSGGYKRANCTLHQHINKSAKDAVVHARAIGCGHVVVENLKGITLNTRKPSRRLGAKRRRWIGRWGVRRWLTRVEAACEMNSVHFHSVCPSYTSQTCPTCGHRDPMNRKGEVFRCLKCDHQAHADQVGALNIVARFVSGPFGAGCKVLDPVKLQRIENVLEHEPF